MLSCLLLDPRFADLNPAVSDGFLRSIQTHNTASFEGKVKPSAPCHKILRHAENPLRYDRESDRQNFHLLTAVSVYFVAPFHSKLT
jgi:hypothetical protein